MTIRRLFIRHLTTTSSTSSRDPTKSNLPHFRFSVRRRHHKVRSKLRNVNRVHAPEADMRPLLPNRDLLLKSLQQTHFDLGPKQDSSRERTRPRRGLAELSDTAWTTASVGDLEGVEQVIGRVLRQPLSSSERARWHRAIVLNSIQAAASSFHTHKVDDVMSLFTARGMLDPMGVDDIGTVLDHLVRHKLTHDEDVAAFRGELMSRALETRLSARTYTRLLERSGRLDTALSLLHRAVAVGVAPNIHMLNRVLELCFAAGDGERAKRVVADMARRSLRPNRRTLATLLGRAEGFEGVDAVFGVVRRAKTAPPADAAFLFLNAYANAATAALSKTLQHDGLHGFVDNTTLSSQGNVHSEYITRCFDVIDWFFDEAGVGVPRNTLNSMVEHFAHKGMVEASLRAWREMRRAWLGDPSIRSRAALYAALSRRAYATKNPNSNDPRTPDPQRNMSTAFRDEALQQRLLRGLHEEEVAKVKRLALREVDSISELDQLVLRSEDNSVSSVKDKATVLHRWARMGRVHDVRAWIESEVRRNKGLHGIDVRLLLPLLSDGRPSRIESLKLLLRYLGSGKIVAGPKDEVVRRVTDRVWLWILSELDDTYEEELDGENEDSDLYEENHSMSGDDGIENYQLSELNDEHQSHLTTQERGSKVDVRVSLPDSTSFIRTLSARDVMQFMREFVGTAADVDEIAKQYELDEEEVELLKITSALLGDLGNFVRICGEGVETEEGNKAE